MSGPDFDVVIVGGGPAGCATALTLADAGISVALVDRPRQHDLRACETVPPSIRRPLERLGMWPRFARLNNHPSPGIESYWGLREPNYRDFLFDPFGNGWHLDRPIFDAMLAEETVSRRVTYRSANVVAARQVSRRWCVETMDEVFRSALLINASGRRAGFVLPIASSRWVCDHTVATVQAFARRGTSSSALIETSPQGWAYTAPLTDQHSVVTLFSDPDLVRGASFAERLATFPRTCERIDSTALHGPVVHRSANAVCRRVVSTASYLCAGDAASTVDPLAGQGVVRALWDGIAVGRASVAMLAGDTDAGVKFQSAIHQRFSADCQTRLGYYRAEARWSDAPFWRRRRDWDNGRTTDGAPSVT